MKILRIAVTVLFVAVAVVFGFVYVGELIRTDNTIPYITIEDSILDVSIKATNDDLLQGVTAYDAKDGDLTKDIIVESISSFYEIGVCKVTYAVCDSNNHVAKATRKIRYTDYTSPIFKLEKANCYSLYESINLSEDIHAIDCMDGNISKNLIITSENYASSIAGVFSMNVTVTNSKGDTSELVLPLVIEDRNLSAPEIELKDYLIYTEVGSSVDFKKYLVSAIDSSENNLKESVKIESNIDFDTPGTYSVHYYVTDESGQRGHSVLIVVVEG